jgi:hypothetical protein
MGSGMGYRVQASLCEVRVGRRDPVKGGMESPADQLTGHEKPLV